MRVIRIIEYKSEHVEAKQWMEGTLSKSLLSKGRVFTPKPYCTIRLIDEIIEREETDGDPT